MRTIEFRYDVEVEDDEVEENEDGKYVLTDGAKEKAFDMLMDGITDTSGGWYPRYMVVCGEDFMAGQICERERGHEHEHGEL